MKTLVSVAVWLVGCGGGHDAAEVGAPHEPPHSPALNKIMKEEVNASYTSLAFLVFHATGAADYAAIATPSDVLSRGIAKVRELGDLPAHSEEARAVFFTYVDSLALDAERFGRAVGARDHAGMEAALGRISKTCNNCHHFFRLAIHDTTGR